MDWKDSLDKYLTSSPDDYFDGWCEEVVNSFSDDFYNENESWINEYNGQCNTWLNKLFNREKEWSQASIIIERAFKLYLNPSPHDRPTKSTHRRDGGEGN